MKFNWTLDKNFTESIFDNINIKEYTNIRKVKGFISKSQGINYEGKKKYEEISKMYKNEYVQKIKNSCSEFTKEEKKILKKCANSVKLTLRQTQMTFGRGFDNVKASEIPIIFGCMAGNEYEGGLPHTRYPAIILYSNQVTSMSVLEVEKLVIHELAHLYQKMYPNDLKKYLNENYFEIIKQRIGNDNVRANPDIDSFIYRNQNNNQAYEYIYNPFPGSIGDVTQSNKEHPFEEMAYKIEKIITSV